MQPKSAHCVTNNAYKKRFTKHAKSNSPLHPAGHHGVHTILRKRHRCYYHKCLLHDLEAYELIVF